MTVPLEELRQLIALKKELVELDRLEHNAAWGLNDIWLHIVDRYRAHSMAVTLCVAYRMGEIDLSELLKRVETDADIEIVLKFCPELTQEKIQQFRLFQ